MPELRKGLKTTRTRPFDFPVANDLHYYFNSALIGLNLIFGIPLELGVLITALDVFIVLYLQKLGFRWVEAFIITLLGVIAFCFGVQIFLADPQWGGVIRGFFTTTEIVTNPEMLYLALAILGATVMPHNLYLHSGIVQTRAYGETLPEKREAPTYGTIDSTVALCFALLINASILILAAAAFNANGKTEVVELGEAHSLLSPLLVLAIAPTLFGIALLCCGLNSAVTAKLAGQIVMEAFLQMKVAPWVRRLIIRAIAIVPASFVTVWYGDPGTAHLPILTQVMLSLQLSFAVFPLVMFTASKAKMGELVAPRWLSAIAWLIAVAIASLNVTLLLDFVSG